MAFDHLFNNLGSFFVDCGFELLCVHFVLSHQLSFKSLWSLPNIMIMSVILQSLLYLISHLLVVKKVVRRRNKVNIVQQIDGVHFVTSDLVGINDTQVLLKDLPRVKELHLVHYLG